MKKNHSEVKNVVAAKEKANGQAAAIQDKQKVEAVSPKKLEEQVIGFRVACNDCGFVSLSIYPTRNHALVALTGAKKKHAERSHEWAVETLARTEAGEVYSLFSTDDDDNWLYVETLSPDTKFVPVEAK